MTRTSVTIVALLACLAATAPAQVSGPKPAPPVRGCCAQASEAGAAAVPRLLKKHTALARGTWGAYFVNLSSGEVLFRKDSDHLFTPASNAKLYATAFAMSKLGPEHRFTTRIVAPARPNPDGTIDGDLTVLGGGDPTMSARSYLTKDAESLIAEPGDPLAAVDALARQISELGVRRITGNIVGDDRAYLWEPYPDGWSTDDLDEDYGAPVSALMLGDNKFSIEVKPGAAVGDPAQIGVLPDMGYFLVTSRVVTGNRTRVRYSRVPGSRRIEVRGEVALRGGARLDLAIDDPARYFAHALREKLLDRGIAVYGEARAHHRQPSEGLEPDAPFGFEVARRTSPPLSDIIWMLNKVSQNLHAEAMLREAGRVEGKVVTKAASIEALNAFLATMGINVGEVSLADGSGLSRLDLVTPEATVKLLRAMTQSPNAGVWQSSLPVGGRDGTLRERFPELAVVEGAEPAPATVSAKTGTMSHITALSGYIKTAANQTLAFSVLTNHFNASSDAARAFVDELVMQFVK